MFNILRSNILTFLSVEARRFLKHFHKRDIFRSYAYRIIVSGSRRDDNLVVILRYATPRFLGGGKVADAFTGLRDLRPPPDDNRFPRNRSYNYFTIAVILVSVSESVGIERLARAPLRGPRLLFPEIPARYVTRKKPAKDGILREK